ncbi:MAG: peptidoglycan DD-metalloendopeptidase family protein [Mizugakiibacter sp.]|uniref:murein hydrolase activator EnvC family protein n=1 Tax=Mizugakiibacter sp. TaxID=1972610 RepID=UPI0031BFBC8E|nr:peptidoglycan DD-metalloendopeptidase family protein [Xanthomonadaceae bacterium]
MPLPPVRRTPPPRRLALAAAGALVLFAALAGAQDNAQRGAQEAATKQKLAAVRAQIDALAKAQRETGAARDSLEAELARQAAELADTAKALRDAEAAVAAKQQALERLQDERGAIGQRLDAQRAALADLLRAAYTLGRGQDLRVLLGGEDLARIARALAYSRYFQRDRIERIRALGADLSRLDAVQASIVTERAALEAVRDQRARQADALEQARGAQQTLLAAAEARLKTQGEQLAALQRDADNLDRLLQRLRDVFADIPKAMPADKPFAQLRGQLPWPLAGKLAVAFGARDRSGASSHGMVIAARPGSAVRAIAHGRIAYADWLRGYGMLVIVDHGDGWMSLYGSNESLLREVGDWVNAGDTIATSGSGADGARGLYFELRQGGKPVDPRPWLTARQ